MMSGSSRFCRAGIRLRGSYRLSSIQFSAGDPFSLRMSWTPVPLALMRSATGVAKHKELTAALDLRGTEPASTGCDSAVATLLSSRDVGSWRIELLEVSFAGPPPASGGDAGFDFVASDAGVAEGDADDPLANVFIFVVRDFRRSAKDWGLVVDSCCCPPATVGAGEIEVLEIDSTRAAADGLWGSPAASATRAAFCRCAAVGMAGLRLRVWG